jgi:hypothetical protein
MGDDRATYQYARTRPRGVPYSELSASQQAVMNDLIEVYVSRLPTALSTRERARITPAGLADTYFAWAGSDRPRRPHYYRIQGPTMLIEYDCAQDAANHVHAVWRDPDRDFARDALAAHRARSH